VPGSFHDSQKDFAEFDLITFRDSMVGKCRAGFFTKDNLGAGAGREFAMAADKISVQVSFDNVFDFEVARVGFLMYSSTSRCGSTTAASPSEPIR